MSRLVLLHALLGLAVSGCAGMVPVQHGNTQMETAFYTESGVALPDSGVYRGQMLDGLFDGEGSLAWRNGDRYEGEFRAGLMHGSGRYTSAVGDVYSGEFLEGSKSGVGVMALASGDRYEGGFKHGLFHGKGVFAAANGDTYSGDFEAGSFSGQGIYASKAGDLYEGYVKAWKPDGAGVLYLKNGDRYIGQFAYGEPSGQMVVEYKNGARYTGEMQDWTFNGAGVFERGDGYRFAGEFKHGEPVGVVQVSDENSGSVYSGELMNWMFHGKGTLTNKDGSKYTGDFKYGHYDGGGSLVSSDGRKYEGTFERGLFHGQGTLEYRAAGGEFKRLTGRWRGGKYAGVDAAAYIKDGVATVDAEKVMYDQISRVETALAGLAPQVAGKPDLYFVGFGSYAAEDVFMKEVQFSSAVMQKHYGAGGHTVSLINNPKTVEEVPLATVSNLEAVINGVANQMDVDEDILFLYVTSHGSREHEIVVDMDGIRLQELPVLRLKQIINDSGIKWKVLVISACYSGGFLEPLRDEYTLVMTASRADRQSFGCGVDADMTYFGRAFFEKSLNGETGFPEAFAHARDLVLEWEKKEERQPSEPQIITTPLIESKLAEWRSSLSRPGK